MQRHEDRPAGWLWRIIALAAAVFFLWFGGFLYFTGQLPQDVGDVSAETDAIVVLTGGAGRLDVGLELLARGQAKKMLISGVDRVTTASAIQRHSPNAAEQFACCVELGHEAENTIGNAMETAMWMEQSDFRSLRLVTAAYHMPRSLLLFGQAMPDVDIVAHPVFPRHVKVSAWWRWPGTAKLLAFEFNKYLVSLLTVRLTDNRPAARSG